MLNQPVSSGTYQTSRVGSDFLRHLNSKESEYAARLLNGYIVAFAEVNADMERLMRRVASGETGISFDLQERRLKSLLRQYQTSIAEFEALARKNITQGRQAAVQDALRYTPDAVEQYLGRAPTGVQKADVTDSQTWSRINKQAYSAVTSMFAATDSPLRASLERISIDTMYAVQTRLQAGILRGQNPLKIASSIVAATSSIALGRARLIARTEFHRAFRAANRSQYDQSDVVKGWVWKANLDAGTCPICVTMGGTQHLTSEILDGHPGCRCVMVPLTKTWAELGFVAPGQPWDVPPALSVANGSGWLMAQGPAGIRKVFGPTRGADILEKIAAGMPPRLAMQSWVGQSYSPLWGPMRTLRTIGGGRMPPPPETPPPPIPPPRAIDPTASTSAFNAHLYQNYGVAVEGAFPLTGTPGSIATLERQAREQMLEAIASFAKLLSLKDMQAWSRLEWKTTLGAHPLQRGGKVPAHYDQSSNVIRIAPEGLSVLGKTRGYGIYDGHDGFKSLMQHEIAHAIHRSLSYEVRAKWSAIVNGSGLGSTKQITTALNRTIQLRAATKRKIEEWRRAGMSESAIARQQDLYDSYTRQIDALKTAKKGLTANKDQPVSDYAKHNENEDFAESMWRYLNTPAYLQHTAPARWAFFQGQYNLYPGM